MPLAHITRESDFEADLEEFAKKPELREELEAALQLLERLRPQEDLSIRTIFGALLYEPCEDFVLSFFVTKLKAELQRRAVFIDDMKQQMREKFAERLFEIVLQSVTPLADEES